MIRIFSYFLSFSVMNLHIQSLDISQNFSDYESSIHSDSAGWTSSIGLFRTTERGCLKISEPEHMNSIRSVHFIAPVSADSFSIYYAVLISIFSVLNSAAEFCFENQDRCFAH